MILQGLTCSIFGSSEARRKSSLLQTKRRPEKTSPLFSAKTGVERPVSFSRHQCFRLYHERQLSQDGDLADNELALANRHELEARSATEKSPMKAYVELAFCHGKDSYVLRRGVLAMRQRTRTIEERDEPRLTVQKHGSSTEVITDPQEIARRINAVLDRGVREYFLFDGEKIERLTRANAQQRQEVSKGIRSLLNIDALENAIRGIQAACRNLNKEIEGRSTGEYKKVVKQISDTTDSISEIRKRVGEIEAESEHAASKSRKSTRNLQSIRTSRLCSKSDSILNSSRRKSKRSWVRPSCRNPHQEREDRGRPHSGHSRSRFHIYR